MSARRSTYERRAWSKTEDDIITRLVHKYGTKRWSVVAEELASAGVGPKRSGKQCRTRYAATHSGPACAPGLLTPLVAPARWLNHLDPTINKGPWTSQGAGPPQPPRDRPALDAEPRSQRRR